jgi:hypothetical protein
LLSVSFARKSGQIVRELFQVRTIALGLARNHPVCGWHPEAIGRLLAAWFPKQLLPAPAVPARIMRTGFTAVELSLSLVEHLVRDQGVGGSNPLSPTKFFQIN